MTNQCKKLVQKLVNLKNQISKVITKSNYLGQDPGDGLWPNHFHYDEIHQSAKQFDYILHEIGNRIRECWWTWTPMSGKYQPDLFWQQDFWTCRSSYLVIETT